MQVDEPTFDSSTGIAFTGRDVNIIEAIAASLNFSINIIPFRGVEYVSINLKIRSF